MRGIFKMSSSHPSTLKTSEQNAILSEIQEPRGEVRQEILIRKQIAYKLWRASSLKMERQLVFRVWLNRADPEIDKLDTDVRLEGMICLGKICASPCFDTKKDECSFWLYGLKTLYSIIHFYNWLQGVNLCFTLSLILGLLDDNWHRKADGQGRENHSTQTLASDCVKNPLKTFRWLRSHKSNISLLFFLSACLELNFGQWIGSSLLKLASALRKCRHSIISPFCKFCTAGACKHTVGKRLYACCELALIYQRLSRIRVCKCCHRTEWFLNE